MRILRASDRIAVPWKNGGGTTSEVAVYPEDASFDDFGWRISIACIDRGGPFSTFLGIDRKLAVLEGRVTLTIEGRAVALSPDSLPAIFPGDVSTSAELIESPASDLNVMTRRGAFTARMERRHLGTHDLAASQDAAARFCFPLTATSASFEGGVARLEYGDAVELDPADGGTLAFAPQTACLWIEIRRETSTK